MSTTRGNVKQLLDDLYPGAKVTLNLGGGMPYSHYLGLFGACGVHHHPTTDLAPDVYTVDIRPAKSIDPTEFIVRFDIAYPFVGVGWCASARAAEPLKQFARMSGLQHVMVEEDGEHVSLGNHWKVPIADIVLLATGKTSCNMVGFGKQGDDWADFVEGEMPAIPARVIRVLGPLAPGTSRAAYFTALLHNLRRAEGHFEGGQNLGDLVDAVEEAVQIGMFGHPTQNRCQIWSVPRRGGGRSA